MMDLQVERGMQADVSFRVGNRVFFVICEVLYMEAFGGKVKGKMVSPAALLVDEDGLLYSVALDGEERDVEEILRLIPALKERIKMAPNSTADNPGEK